jgi:hypothetical protein
MSEGKVKRRPRTRRPGYIAVIDLIAALAVQTLAADGAIAWFSSNPFSSWLECRSRAAAEGLCRR